MGGYTKNIAVIRGLKDGFSADGGNLSGLVRAEKYGSALKIEVSLINFAPLSEGRYVAALSDGTDCVLVENCFFEGESKVNPSCGFAACIFYVNGGVFPVASAICGSFHAAAAGLKEFVEREEGVLKRGRPAEGEYEDEAIAEENYYEYAETDKNGGAVCEDKEKEEVGRTAFEDAQTAGSFEEGQSGVESADAEGSGQGAKPQGGVQSDVLARGGFYEKMKDEIEGLLSSYPAEEALCRTVENSRWVRISYGGDAFYVFGVIYSGGKPQYICYGVPAKTSGRPPESMAGMAGYIPASPDGTGGGYWVMYQDAATGASLHISFE